jgi:hypothetical protein
MGVTVPSREHNMQRRVREARRLQSQSAGSTEVVEVQDTNWRQDAAGLPGQQLSLSLLLRVVADVGIVGFPNAGEASWAQQCELLWQFFYPVYGLMYSLSLVIQSRGDSDRGI